MTTVAHDVTTRPYHDDDEAAVLDLLRRSLGDGPTGERSTRTFRWKHLANPFGRSYLVVAESDARIVGLRAFLRWRFRAGAIGSVTAVRAVDTATDPAHQGRGIFTMLTRQALEDLRGQADLIFNTPNGRSLPGYLKLGWRPVGTVPVVIRPRRPAHVARNRHRVGLDDEPDTPRPSVEAPSVAEALERAHPHLEGWIAAASPSAQLTTDRDVRFLTWRYAEAPLDYHALWTPPSRGSAGGMAIFRVRARGRLWETTLTELLVPDGDAAVARDLVRRVSAAAATDHVAGLLPATRSAPSTLRRGFVPIGRGPTLVVHPLRDGLVPDPTDPDAWAFSLGDVELF